MDRKIQWNCGCFDEIELVYDKAEKDTTMSQLLSQLEEGALAEAKAHSGMLRVQDRPVTAQEFDGLPDDIKEQLMAALAGVGLSAFNAPLSEAQIIVRLSPQIQLVRCCTAFSILNRLEKLDGAYNVLHPRATLVIQAPLGGKKGLIPIEMLISLLYPWLSVTEVSTNEAAVSLPSGQPQPKPAEPKIGSPAEPPVQNPPGETKESKPGFWARLFGRKKTQAAPEEKQSAAVAQTPREKFYREMWAKPAFRSAFSYAKAELNSVIIKKQFTLRGRSGGDLSVAEWEGFNEMQQLQYILAMGNHGIVPSALLCIDFVEIIPYCLAITLLYLAYTGQKETQTLDTGDGADITVFKSAIHLLSGCCAKWNCRILTE